MPIHLFALIFIHIYEPLITLERYNICIYWDSNTIYKIALIYQRTLHHKYNWDSTFIKEAWQNDYIPLVTVGIWRMPQWPASHPLLNK
jgi:hypothetical protein